MKSPWLFLSDVSDMSSLHGAYWRGKGVSVCEFFAGWIRFGCAGKFCGIWGVGIL